MVSDKKSFDIRETITATDRSKIAHLLHSSGYFLPREMAYGMDLFDEHLIKGDISQYRFILYEHEHALLGYGCYGAIRLSEKLSPALACC